MVKNINSTLNDSDFFERRYNEGYTEAAFGGEGILIRNTRIVRLVAFFHPIRYFRKVATYHESNFSCGLHEDRGDSFEKSYTKKDFEEYILKNKISLSNRQNLSELLEGW